MVLLEKPRNAQSSSSAGISVIATRAFKYSIRIQPNGEGDLLSISILRCWTQEAWLLNSHLFIGKVGNVGKCFNLFLTCRKHALFWVHTRFDLPFGWICPTAKSGTPSPTTESASQFARSKSVNTSTKSKWLTVKLVPSIDWPCSVSLHILIWWPCTMYSYATWLQLRSSSWARFLTEICSVLSILNVIDCGSDCYYCSTTCMSESIAWLIRLFAELCTRGPLINSLWGS